MPKDTAQRSKLKGPQAISSSRNIILSVTLVEKRF